MGNRGRAALLVTAGYLLATTFYVAPLLPRWDKDIPSSRPGYDAPFQAFLLAWGWDALRHRPQAVFDAPIFHPEPRTLTYMDSLLGEVAAAAPVLGATGSVAAGYNFLCAISCFLSAWFTYRLARTVGAGRGGAFLAGLLFAFSTYRLTNSDFLNQLQTQFLPLGLHFGYRFLQRGRWRHAAGMAATVATQAYFGWYYTFILVVGLGLLAIHAFARGASILPRGGWPRAALLALGTAAVVAPIAIPNLQQRAAMPSFRRTLGQTALYSADVFDYLRASDLSFGIGRLGLPAGIGALFPGIVMIVLAGIGVREVARARPIPATGPGRKARRGLRGLLAALTARGGAPGYFPFLALSAFVLSLGPVLHVAGKRLLIPLPYIVAYFIVPGLSSLRAPFRFSVLVFLAGAVLAGLGLGAVERFVRPRWPGWRQPLYAAAVALALVTAWPASTPTLRLPTAGTMDPAYRWLRAQEPKLPLLEFPTPADDGGETKAQALRQYVVVLHGSPRLDGCSGFVSPRYRSFRREIQAFPDSSARSLAARMGARWILVHYGAYPAGEGEALRRRIEGERALTRVFSEGGDAVYRLDAAP